MSEIEKVQALINRIETDAFPGFGDLSEQCLDSVGALRAMVARFGSEGETVERCPHAALEVMGNIQIDEGGELQTYLKALVITFASTEDIRRAIAAGKCTFAFKE